MQKAPLGDFLVLGNHSLRYCGVVDVTAFVRINTVHQRVNLTADEKRKVSQRVWKWNADCEKSNLYKSIK